MTHVGDDVEPSRNALRGSFAIIDLCEERAVLELVDAKINPSRWTK